MSSIRADDGDATAERQSDRFHYLAVELRDLLWLPPALRPRIAISSCLLGEPVRWDGGHKHAAALQADFAEWAELVASCPEVGSGLPVPRPPLAVALDGGGTLRLVERDSGRDHGESARRFIAARVAELAPLDGSVGKARSPSCARRGIAVIGAGGGAVASGGGLFARAVAAAFPRIPQADERELASAAARAAFRLAAEWQLGWRFTAQRAQHSIPLARLHRKLRGFLVEVEPRVARELDRAAAAGGAVERYAGRVAVQLNALAARVARRGG